MNYKMISSLKDIRKQLLHMHLETSHIASSLSSLEIIYELYSNILNIDSMDDQNRDRFILSKGHAVSALYCVLKSRGLLEYDVYDFTKNGSMLFSHPDRRTSKSIEISAGSLGHGLAIAVGMALAAKYNQLNYQVFVLMGDGECEEGSVWEAASIASRFKLNNLIVLIDSNGLQDSDYVNNIMPIKSFKNKWESFDWELAECNNVSKELSKSILNRINDKPLAIIVHTIKGKGIKEIEQQIDSHRFIVPKEKIPQYTKDIEELETI